MTKEIKKIIPGKFYRDKWITSRYILVWSKIDKEHYLCSVKRTNSLNREKIVLYEEYILQYYEEWTEMYGEK